MDAPDRHAPLQDASRVRDHLANERTLLSWVRLGLSAAGFGFVVARFGLFLRESSGQSASAHPGRFTEWIGVVLILLGPVIVIVAALRFFRTEREIDENVYHKRYGPHLVGRRRERPAGTRPRRLPHPHGPLADNP